MTYPHTAEYGQIKANHWPMSVRTVIEMLNGYTFATHSDGYEIAGSAVRWNNKCYSVTRMIDGARHGKRFETFGAALGHFNKVRFN